MLDHDGEIVTLCKCCVLENSVDVLNYDIKSDKELEQKEFVQQGLMFLGKGKRTNLMGCQMLSDRRIDNENPIGYFYKKIEKENNESKKD